MAEDSGRKLHVLLMTVATENYALLKVTRSFDNDNEDNALHLCSGRHFPSGQSINQKLPM